MYVYICICIYVYMLIDFLLTSNWIQTPDIWSQAAAMAVSSYSRPCDATNIGCALPGNFRAPGDFYLKTMGNCEKLSKMARLLKGRFS